MAFCSKCGTKFKEGDKFCSCCGSKITISTSLELSNIICENSNKKKYKYSNDENGTTEPTETKTSRKIEFDGEIHKCPNCGETLKAFELVCPICGYELRNANNSNSIKELQEKLLSAKTEEQRITIIQTFPIPNTKEDIFEFMFLATSSFDASYYVNHLEENDISDAWLAKIEQCYRKASYMFTNQTDFERIKGMYENVISEIEKHKKIEKKKNKKKSNERKKEVNWIVFTILFVLFWPAAIGYLLNSKAKN